MRKSDGIGADSRVSWRSMRNREWVIALLASWVTLLVGGVTIVATSSTGTALVIGYVLTAIAMMCLVIALLVSGAFRSTAQRFWRLFPVEVPSIGLQEVRVPSRRDVAENHSFSFMTRNYSGRVVTIRPPDLVTSTDNPEPPRPTRVVFSSPHRRTVRSSDLPAEVPGRRGNMTVTKFVAGGFVINEGHCAGDAVAGEMFYD